MDTYPLSNGYAVTVMELAEGQFNFETTNSAGDVVSNVTKSGQEARDMLRNLSVVAGLQRLSA